MSGSKRPSQKSSGGGKASRTSQSDSPSASANNKGGRWQIENQLCSVLCHPLGLPLVSAFHGKDPRELPYLGQESEYFPTSGKDKDSYGDVLTSAVNTWREGEKKETNLTTILNDVINSNNKIPLKAEAESRLVGAKLTGRVDLTLYPTSDDDATMPLMFVEVGLNGALWWKKFDQGVTYVQIKYEKRQEQTFKEPLLLVIMTVEDDTDSKPGDNDLGVKLGVFLCTRKNDYDENEEDESEDDDNGNDESEDEEQNDEENEDEMKKNFRISLLWHSKTRTLEDGSKAFGRLLRRVCDFSSWLAKLDDPQNKLDYEYFSSNCCRVGEKSQQCSQHVLRSYDNRVRPTSRSPDVYLSEECKEIVGDSTSILNLPVTSVDLSASDKKDKLWNVQKGRSLQVILTPYRPGIHFATKPKSFLPIIDQLDKLHKKGFVHGDIRGFNTVFDEANESAWLIDFDFGGKYKSAHYPIGYRLDLRDGKRRKDPKSTIIQKWHDWYALGRLIFEIHKFVSQQETPHVEQGKLRIFELNEAWSSQHATDKMIAELKDFLTECEKAKWTVQPREPFADELKSVDRLTKLVQEGTNPRATGSPPKG